MQPFYLFLTPKSIFNHEKILLYFHVIYFIYCNKQPTEPLQINEEITPQIISHEHTVSFSGMILKFFAHGFTHSLDDFIFKDVQGIKIIYQTVDQYNELTEASGMLIIPENFDGNGPLVSLQHSALAEDSKAPTNSDLGGAVIPYLLGTFKIIFSQLELYE